MRNTKKIINDPKQVVRELLEGVALTSGGRLRLLPDSQVIIRSSLPGNKVGILIGGGSGHEPLFPGLVGEGMADAAACGNIFAAPSPDVVLAGTRAVDQGRGVLYLYGNYSGDNMNFDMGAELAGESGIDTATVRVWDDVAAAPPERFDQRRGIAGDLLVIKIAGAAAQTGANLQRVSQLVTKARDLTRTMGVAVTAGSIPETGAPTFELPDDEIELGMGLHGEPGVWREKLPLADPLVENLMTRLLADLPFQSGDRVVVLLNDLGATTWMELLIVGRKVHQILAGAGIAVHETIVGSFCTCQEMAGFSVSLLRVDAELESLFDKPCWSLAFRR